MADDDEMDTGEVFRDMRRHSREKRARNRDNSAALLERAGASFDARNGGAHLIGRHGGQTVDFWPGTGKWLVRDGRAQGRGVHGLLRHLGVRVPAQDGPR